METDQFGLPRYPETELPGEPIEYGDWVGDQPMPVTYDEFEEATRDDGY